MLRALILLFTVLVSLGLAYAFGLWVLVALFAVAFAILAFSTRTVEESADGSPLTSIEGDTTMAAELWSVPETQPSTCSGGGTSGGSRTGTGTSGGGS